jgi:hypothetical protein
MQMLQQLASSDTKEIVEFQEDLVWEPLLARVAKMNAMFLSDEKTLRMAGTKGAQVVVNREMFKHDYAYEWLGTETVRNQTVLSAQMLVAMNIARGIPPQMGIPNIKFFFEQWWTMQGLKNAEKVFVNTPPDSVDPKIELEVLAAGRKIQVSPLDNDPQHMIQHERDLATLQPGTPMANDLSSHVLEHEASAMHKHMAQMQAMLAQQNPPPPPLPHGYSVNLKGQAPGNTGDRLMGPSPAGSRAGTSPNGVASPTSGMGPSRAMAGMPGGA